MQGSDFMKEIVSDIMSRLVTAGAKLRDYFNEASPGRKIAMIAPGALLVVIIGALLLSISSGEELHLSSLSVIDANGDQWTLEPVMGQPLSLIKGNAAQLGPPLIVKTDVQTSGNIVSIGLVVQGQAGEQYVGGAKKNGQWEPAPKLKIIDEAGRLLASGEFEYG